MYRIESEDVEREKGESNELGGGHRVSSFAELFNSIIT